MKNLSHSGNSLKSAFKVTKKPSYCKSDAIIRLENLAFEAKKLRYPNIPTEYLLAEKYRDNTANSLTKCVIDYIRLKGGQAERINTTGRPIDRSKTFTDVLGYQKTIGSIEWIPGNGTVGSADISATISGRSVKIEVKIGSDRQSLAQKNYQRQVETAFGVYYIARSFDAFVIWYNQLFEKP